MNPSNQPQFESGRSPKTPGNHAPENVPLPAENAEHVRVGGETPSERQARLARETPALTPVEDRRAKAEALLVSLKDVDLDEIFEARDHAMLADLGRILRRWQLRDKVENGGDGN